MQHLSKRNVLLIGITLFSMFFGAGNLIFPPYLGYGAGTAAVPAVLGFLATAVVFPVLGVTAVAKAGGLDHLCERVHPKFALFFSIVVYLCIGPMLAIPRTAGTSYSMFAFLTDRLGTGMTLGISTQLLASLCFSAVFFIGAGMVAHHPEHFKDLFGKCMTPILIVLILLLFGGALMHPEYQAAEPSAVYAENPFGRGFVDGYQTLDTMAAIVFGIVIAININALGIKEPKQVAAETVKGGVIAGIFLALIYGMLTFVGARSGSLAEGAQNGTEILTAASRTYFGGIGEVILALIFFIACFNVCVGLIASCAEFFSSKFRFFNLNQWIWTLTVWSFLISIAGLNAILAVSVPVLSVFYPVAILIIMMNLLPFAFLKKSAVQRCAVILALAYGVWSIL